MSWALRGEIEMGAVQRSLFGFDTEPTLEQALQQCAPLVEQMPTATKWFVVADERQPEPKPAKAEATA